MRPLTFFRFPQDRIPVAIFLTYFALDLVVFFSISQTWILVLWYLIGIYPKGLICAWNHHHQHVFTFKQSWLNRLLEIPFAFQTGICSHGWVLHHVFGHHQNYLDQTKDESRWAAQGNRRMGALEYTLVTTLTAYPRSFKVGLKHKKHLRVMLGMGFLVLLLLAAAFIYNPLNAFWVFMLPMLTSLTLTVWATFYHHSGLQTDDHFVASYNSLHPVYNLLTGNLGYHTAHHYKCGVHWSQLPQLHQQIASKIPLNLYHKPEIPYCWIPDQGSKITPKPPLVVVEASGEVTP